MAKQAKVKGRKRPVAKIVFAVALVALAIALNVGTSMFSSLLDHYLGGRPSQTVVAEGSENWDANYYDAKYRGRNQANRAAQDVVAEVEGEGAVLLKNDNNALPLDTSKTVSLLGRYAADAVYGGAGSGTVDPSDCVTLCQGLQNAGFTINDTAYGWISQNYPNYAKADITMDSPSTASYYIGEIPWSDYPADVQYSVTGTTGVIVIGRGGGEGGDLSTNLKESLDSGVSKNFTDNNETANYEEGQHELELTREEKELITAAKQSCDKVVVLLNCSTTMEVGSLMSGEYSVDAILNIGSLGASGANGVGNILSGAVNPSGKTCDLWSADFTKDPTFQNFGGKRYTDVSDYYGTNHNNTPSDGTAYFTEYREGIYVGYRYYETAAAEVAAGNYTGFDYDQAVVFPFGYGLSYTTFSETLDSVENDGKTVTASVTVTNTGPVAGKQVAEIYYSAPYTKGGVEKSAVVLGAFEKTKLLEPGESQTLKLAYDIDDMASWDSSANGGKGAYVLDAGDYVVSLRTDSHTVVDSKALALDARTITKDSAAGNDIQNEFADTTKYMRNNGGVMSRADFAGTFPKPAEDKASSDVGVSITEYQAQGDPGVQMPTTGASNGVSLIDLRGKDYDDPLWDKLLDQLTVDEMTSVINDGAYNTAEVPSISKPATSDPDGPAGFTSLTGSTGNCAYCSEYVMAQTWNKELIYAVGQAVGQEALSSGYSGWYAPAANTHRSPFAGRNFEYFSEDPVLAGNICAAEVSGAASNGVYAYVKHFALNDQEGYRIQHLMTWADEQTIREVYLRPFEITVKDATYEERFLDGRGEVQTRTAKACTGIMSSFNYIGTEWTGGRRSLLTNVLRDEWGFRGMVITDFNLYGYMDKSAALAAGNDLQLTYSAMSGSIPNANGATTVSQMRQAMHNILYTVVNSNAVNGIAPGTIIKYGIAPWQYGVYAATVVLVLLATLLGFLSYRQVKCNAVRDA